MDVQRSRAWASVQNPARVLGSVLVIDDDAGIRSVIADLLISAGYTVEQACDGQTGLRLAEKILPDVILLNLALPKHSSLDVLTRLNEQQPTREIGVTIVSTYAMVLGRNKAGGAETETECLLQKPFDLQELLQRVR